MFLKSTNQILMVISEICNSPMFAVSKIIVYMNLDYLSRYMLPYQNKMNCQLMLIYDMKLVTKYQISAINSCWEKCDEKWAYMFNVYKNQLSRQTGSRNLTVQKRYPKYGIPVWRLWPNIRFLSSTVTENNATKNILDGRTDRVKTVCTLPLRGVGVEICMIS